MTDITLKQGETFNLNGQYMEDDGTTPKSLAGITLSSQVRDHNYNLVDTLVITVINESLGTFSVESSMSTSLWKLGTLYWDLKQTKSGVTSLSSTTTILLERAVTRV